MIFLGGKLLNSRFFKITVSAYHLKWDDSTLEQNIGKWAVNVIQLSRDRRHLDRAK